MGICLAQLLEWLLWSNMAASVRYARKLKNLKRPQILLKTYIVIQYSLSLVKSNLDESKGS